MISKIEPSPRTRENGSFFIIYCLTADMTSKNVDISNYFFKFLNKGSILFFEDAKINIIMLSRNQKDSKPQKKYTKTPTLMDKGYQK